MRDAVVFAALLSGSAAVLAQDTTSRNADGSSTVSVPTVSAAQGVGDVPIDTTQLANEIHSPMILAAPFPLADRSIWGTGRWADPDVLRPFRDFRCDGIAIAEMRMRGKLNRNGKLAADVKGEFYSLPGHDKRVDMKIELLNGDTLIGVAYVDRLKAPEGETKKFSFEMDIPAGGLQPKTRMRITFTDYDY